MKLLVFAHTPPPHHGQSQMVAHLLDGFGGDARTGRLNAPGTEWDIRCYHVDARLSENLEDVGSARGGKVFALLGHIVESLGIRLRNRVPNFYYVPSPPKRSSLYRDWIVMLICRVFFRRVIFHWHSVGLGSWLEREAWWWERWVSHRLLDRASLAIVLSKFNEADALKLQPRRIEVVANGIPDPCPDFEQSMAPQRRVRAARLRAAFQAGHSADEPMVARVFFMALCTRDKGVLDTVHGVLRANVLLQERGLPLRLQVTLAGTFVNPGDKAEFDTLQAKPEAQGVVRQLGFLDAASKAAAFREADVFCFPTYYANEGQPLNLIEAMAWGLPLVTTRWRAIPEYVPDGYPGLIEPQQPEQIARALLSVLSGDHGPQFRETFQNRFTLPRHLAALAAALNSVAIQEKRS
jgi:glycosyltransferase involved in cell wall biosynthesis